MGVNTCMNCLRWLVFILNLLFWLAGLGVLGVGLWLRFEPEIENYMEHHHGLHDFYVGVYILIAVGAVMAILGFLGCCGAWRESQCMLVSFFILLVLVFCAELACGILAYTHQDTVSSYLKNSMEDTVYRLYDYKPTFTEFFDKIQNGLECCGINGYLDWLKSYYVTEYLSKRPEIGVGDLDTGRVPRSCCNENGILTYPTDCGTGFTKDALKTYEPFLHKQGCSQALYAKFYNNLEIIIGLAIGIGAVQLVGMVLSMLLCCWIGHRKEEDRKTGGYY